MLIYMNLSSNLLQGSIPDSVGKLLSIEELYLSANVPSRVIPTPWPISLILPI